MDTEDYAVRLREVLSQFGELAVAVSGGVDSMTLATYAHRLGHGKVTMFHAVSAAVPPAATARVKAAAASEGWPLQIIAPGELEQEAYVANPIDRCWHCKHALYATILAKTGAQIASGANTDDLGDYRPGLKAAAEAAVRHPFIEAGIGKAGVREIARALGLGEIAELPPSPCLSSRIETGTRISPSLLRTIDSVETMLRTRMTVYDVRCRMRGSGIVVELDKDALSRLDPEQRSRLARDILLRFAKAGLPFDGPPRFEPYRMGSAFVGARNA